jgi:signal transduction histidine kinase
MGTPSIRVIIGVVGLAWGLVSEAIYYAAGTPPYQVLLDLAIGWTYLYGGLALWSSRPDNRTGRLMTLVGLTWFIGNVSISDIVLFSQVAAVLSNVVTIALVALVLAYPNGRLDTRLDRATVVILAVGLVANDAIQFAPVPQWVDLALGRLYVTLALIGFAGLMIVRRWLLAPRRRRPELLPVLIAGSVLMGVLVVNLVSLIITVPEEIRAFLDAARILAPAAIPLALLVGFYGQSELRQRALLDAMPDVMIRMTRDGHVLDARPEHSVLLGSAVGPVAGGRLDRTLTSTDSDAVLAAASTALDTGELQTLDLSIELPGRRHDLEVRITPSGADEVTAIVRDFTEQRADQAEVLQSRARIVEATDAERRRLERDLHDGAQQRLVSLSLALRLARSRLGADASPAAVADLESAAAELRTALIELRELARGIHPAILTEAGLGPAIETLADRSTVSTIVRKLPDRRLPPAVEATAYFVVSEALVNVAKYASATTATVSAECLADSLRVEVADDGVGGAEASQGSGLRGLRDRVAALGGRLSVDSPRGGGTLLVAEIPLGE